MERIFVCNFWDPRWFRTVSTDLNWWNPLGDRQDARVRAGPNGWKEIADAVIQDINTMSRTELFQLTENISRTPVWPIGRQFLIYDRFKIFGEGSSDAYFSVFQSILYKLEDRLEEGVGAEAHRLLQVSAQAEQAARGRRLGLARGRRPLRHS